MAEYQFGVYRPRNQHWCTEVTRALVHFKGEGAWISQRRNGKIRSKPSGTAIALFQKAIARELYPHKQLAWNLQKPWDYVNGGLTKEQADVIVLELITTAFTCNDPAISDLCLSAGHIMIGELSDVAKAYEYLIRASPKEKVNMKRRVEEFVLQNIEKQFQ